MLLPKKFNNSLVFVNANCSLTTKVYVYCIMLCNCLEGNMSRKS